MKLTKKYFRDRVNENVYSALSVLPLIVSKYGKNPKGHRKMKSIKIPTPNSFWDHYLNEFYFYKDKLYAGLTWCGDSTDGEDSIQIISGKTHYRIPAEFFDDGYRTRTVHSDIVVDAEELHKAIKAVVNSL